MREVIENDGIVPEKSMKMKVCHREVLENEGLSMGEVLENEGLSWEISENKKKKPTEC